MNEEFSMSVAIANVGVTLHNGPTLRRVTKYLSPTLVVRATRRRRKLKYRNDEFHLTIGKPNHREREFVKACKKAGESFPVRKLQLQPWPKKKVK